MKNIYLSICTLILSSILLVNQNGFAGQKVAASSIAVEDAYIRETIPGTSISSAYMTIVNSSDKNIKLLGAVSNISKRIEIHEHTMTDGMMRMRQRPNIEIVAKSNVVLQPSGYHLMIFDLKQPLKQGQNATITLQFSNDASVEVKLPIKSIKQMKMSPQSNHQHH